MKELSKDTKNLISRYRQWRQSLQPKEGASTIHVDEIASKVASAYEKVRMIIDWKEEHLMRRAAIIRKLKMRFLGIELTDFSAGEEMAESLILELIRGGHFPNDRIEESKIPEVNRILQKYAFILKNSPSSENERGKIRLYSWLLEIAACEIEETLAPLRREKALIAFMFELMKEQITINEGVFVIGGLKEEEKDIQIYIAVQQALFKLDNPIISYNIIKYRYPYWLNPSSEQLSEIAQNIYKIWETIEKDLSHQLGKKFYAICERYDTPYLLLGDILLKENLNEVEQKLSNPATFEGLIREAYDKRLSTLKTRLFRAAFYSTLSIFLCNSLSLMVLEIPLAKLITGTFSPITILVDILGPTLLMFLFVTTVRPPSETNFKITVMETMKVVYKREKPDTYEIKVLKRRGAVLKFIISLLYLCGAFISFGAIYWIFKMANFPPTSVVINIMFVSLIVFTGLAIRKRAEELTVEKKSGGLLGFLFDILSLPVAGTGRWLSHKWKKYNAIAAFFNALIDMPFSIFVAFIEQWRYFLKEKKEEIH